MKILCIGDVVSRPGREKIHSELKRIKDKYGISLAIINGENLSHGRGISRKTYEEMIEAGVDAFTLGNHTWDCKDSINILSYNNNIIRPANYKKNCPGKGAMIIKTPDNSKVGIINIIGRTYMYLGVINKINMSFV